MEGNFISEYVRIKIMRDNSACEIRRELAEDILSRKLFHHCVQCYLGYNNQKNIPNERSIVLGDAIVNVELLWSGGWWTR